jgi:hypothetical protein
MGTDGVAFAFKKRGMTWRQFPCAADIGLPLIQRNGASQIATNPRCQSGGN